MKSHRAFGTWSITRRCCAVTGVLRCPRIIVTTQTFIGLLMLANAAPVFADKNWANPAGGYWGLPSNWVEGALPNSSDNVNIDLTGSGSAEVVLNVPYSSNLAL